MSTPQNLPPPKNAGSATDQSSNKKPNRNRNRNRGNKGTKPVVDSNADATTARTSAKDSSSPGAATTSDKVNKGKQSNTNNRRNRAQNKKQVAVVAAIDNTAEKEAELKKRQEEQERLAEQKKIEQEQIQRKKQQDELNARLAEVKTSLQSTLDQYKQRQNIRQQMLTLNDFRTDFEKNQKKLLKSDLKKCTTFVKKIKSGTIFANTNSTTNSDAILRDLTTLNLSRYVEEVASALVDIKTLKATDIPLVISITVAMHLRYPDFIDNLVPALWSNVMSSTTTPDLLKLKRVHVRLLTELLATGVSSDSRSMVECIAEASGYKKEKEQSNAAVNVTDPNLLVAFGKVAGYELLGGMPPKSTCDDLDFVAKYTTETQNDMSVAPDTSSLAEAQDLAQQVRSFPYELAVTPEVAEKFRTMLTLSFHSLTRSLKQTHSKLLNLEQRCQQDRLLAGSLNDTREKGLQDARKLKDNLQKSVAALANVLNLAQPELEADNSDELEANNKGGLEVWTGDTDDNKNDLGPFDDEETKAFYCNIPDFLSTIPAALLGLTPEAIEVRKIENAAKYGDQNQIVETELEGIDNEVELDLPADDKDSADAESNDLQMSGDGAKVEGQNLNKDAPHYKLMVLLDQELPECHRREQLDELAEKFCTNHGSSKAARKRLAKTIFQVPFSRLDLLPYYSRLAAILDRIWSDVAASVLTDLEQQFHGQTKYKKNQNLESRVKTSRFIGELTKFRVAPPMVFLRCMSRCLEDFTGNNVEVACCLLESCGRFLYRLPHTHKRITDIMETMLRLSGAKNLDERQVSMIKTSFYVVKPPPSGPAKKIKQYPPLESYLRHLLIERLEPTEECISFTAKQILRLPWQDPALQCGELVCRIMLKACRRGRYKAVQAIASIASHLRSHRTGTEASCRMIDAVLEELAWAMEKPDFRDQQKTIVYTRLFGELYIQGNQVSNQVVFEQLYDFINKGHEIPASLKELSKEMTKSTPKDVGPASTTSELPVYNSASGISQTINEDEEADAENLALNSIAVPAEVQPVAVSEYSLYDPRVPSGLDPPNAAYRVKLVCTLLETVAEKIVTKSNIPKLEAFLAAFQRYLFTKDTLPTDVEFSLLDTFDALDSQWRRLMTRQIRKGKSKTVVVPVQSFERFKTWIDAHNYTVKYEEKEALKGLKSDDIVNNDKLNEDEHSLSDNGEEEEEYHDDDDASVSNDTDDESHSENDSNMDDTNGGDVDAASDVEDEENIVSASEDSDAADDSIPGDDSATYEDDEDDAYYDDDEEEYNEEAYMRQVEEEEFESELRRLSKEALEKGKNASRKQVSDSMPSGSQILKKKASESDKMEENKSPMQRSTAFPGSGVTLQLLRKSNKGKMEAKELVVPDGNMLAKIALRKDDAAARERDEIKQRVLRYEAESAEAELSGGNVYLEQEKLQIIRNRPLSIDDIDKNFGTSGGSYKQTNESRPTPSPSVMGRSATTGRGRGRGFGRGRGNLGGRTLFRG